jgi:uncharacterized protein
MCRPQPCRRGAGVVSDSLDLLDWRRRTAELFAEVRRRPPSAETAARFRAAKDGLFRDHPASALPPERRESFAGLAYWPYDPAGRVVARFTADAEEAPATVPVSRDGEDMAFSRIGWLDFDLAGAACRLGAFWIHGYAGGLFVPFRDRTSGTETYGAGRYLLDTIKGADLGSDARAGTVVLDFNYAYHPSCAYDPRWACPLAPPENRLAVPVRFGERLTLEGPA